MAKLIFTDDGDLKMTKVKVNELLLENEKLVKEKQQIEKANRQKKIALYCVGALIILENVAIYFLISYL